MIQVMGWDPGMLYQLQILLNSCFMCPFVVVGEGGRCLEMSSSVSPG